MEQRTKVNLGYTHLGTHTKHLEWYLVLFPALIHWSFNNLLTFFFFFETGLCVAQANLRFLALLGCTTAPSTQLNTLKLYLATTYQDLKILHKLIFTSQTYIILCKLTKICFILIEMKTS